MGVNAIDMEVTEMYNSGGTINHNALNDLPTINGVQLKGDLTSEDLGLIRQEAIQELIEALELKANIEDLAAVAFSGNSKDVNGLAKVAETGSYNDLTDQPEGSALSMDLVITKPVGGVTFGKTYPVGTNVEDILKDILNPVENPAFTMPSATITGDGPALLEAGTTANKTLTISFNRGTINPAYGTSGYRSGEAISYQLNAGAEQSSNKFNVEVSESNNSFTGTVNYAAGEQPKNSIGSDYDSPLAAGSVNTNRLSFEFVDPIWSNAANISAVAKEALVSKSAKQKQFYFPAQTATDPEVFDIPASWSVTAVEVLNTLSNQWQDATSEFDITDVAHGAVAYKRYTYNQGIATGSRSVRVKWN